MHAHFTPHAWDDYLHWQTADKSTLRKLNALIKDTQRNPFVGLGQPEPLKGNLSGWWSRRITQEHRMVYRIVGEGDTQALQIAMCRYHY